MFKVITGGVVEDRRGQIRFINEFNMSLVKRFYIIKNKDLDLVRGWRAHKVEQRWFYALSGGFSIDLIRIDNWDVPSKDLAVHQVVVHSSTHTILHVPAGYATAIQALEAGSELLVFADHPISHASFDDYTYELKYFKNRNG